MLFVKTQTAAITKSTDWLHEVDIRLDVKKKPMVLLVNAIAV